jgi:hypothetical protein
MRTTTEYIELSEKAVHDGRYERAAGFAKLAEITITNRITEATVRNLDAQIKIMEED